MLKVVIIGYGELGAALIKGVLKTNHQIVGLLSWDRRKTYSRIMNQIFPEEIELLRKRHRLPVLEVDSVNGYPFAQKMSDIKPDVILIGSWGEILKKHVFSLATKYCINCHPSLLPEHRGSNPYASAIVHGAEYSGVTFHEVDERIDTGNIILQQKIPIVPNDTGATLRDKCANLAQSLVVKLLEDIKFNKIESFEQDETKASYYPRLKAEDGAINWNNTAENIHNQIRGLHPWIHSYAIYANNLVLIKRSKIVDVEFNNNLPGTIINLSAEGVLVSTISPKKAILLNNLEIFGLNEFLSNIYLKRILCISKQFTNAL